MNVFFLDNNPIKCAQYHFDKHVVKMILEYTQILSTAKALLDENLLSEEIKSQLWGPIRINHPSVIWGRQSAENYIWLYNLLCALLDEYTHRYNKQHTCERFRELLKQPPQNIKTDSFTPPYLAMPEEYRQECAIASYRTYYQKGKSHLAKWTKREIPHWYSMKEIS